MIEINKHKYTFPKILTFGFLIVIFMGTILLSLPFATRPGETTNFMTAFFTSTSATCVTGLTLVSTAHHWTLFGQIVIAILMEVGGLGFMTFAVMMSLLIRQRMRMSTRLLTQEALNLDHLSQLNVVYLIIRLSLLIQLAGGIFLLMSLDLVECASRASARNKKPPAMRVGDKNYIKKASFALRCRCSSQSQ